MIYIHWNNSNDLDRGFEQVPAHHHTYRRATVLFLSSMFILIFCISCEKEIEFSGKNTEPLLVVNCLITPDSSIVAQITESRFFLNEEDTFRVIDNATIQVYVEDVLTGNMNGVSNGFYKAGYVPKIGETIRLKVSVPGFKVAWCETKIEKPAQIFAIDTTSIMKGITGYNIVYDHSSDSNDTLGYNYDMDYHFSLDFKDPESEQNYYRLLVKQIISIDGTIASEQYDFNFTDIVSGENADSEANIDSESNYPNTYHVFSDELFNGKEYPLKFSVSVMATRFIEEYPSPQHETRKVVIELQAISKSYYLYLKTLAASGNENLFTEPVQIHSNVHGGIGIMGSYSSDGAQEIDLPF